MYRLSFCVLASTVALLMPSNLSNVQNHLSNQRHVFFSLSKIHLGEASLPRSRAHSLLSVSAKCAKGLTDVLTVPQTSLDSYNVVLVARAGCVTVVLTGPHAVARFMVMTTESDFQLLTLRVHIVCHHAYGICLA